MSTTASLSAETEQYTRHSYRCIENVQYKQCLWQQKTIKTSLVKISTHHVECQSRHPQNQCLSNPIQRSCQIPRYEVRKRFHNLPLCWQFTCTLLFSQLRSAHNPVMCNHKQWHVSATKTLITVSVFQHHLISSHLPTTSCFFTPTVLR